MRCPRCEEITDCSCLSEAADKRKGLGAYAPEMLALLQEAATELAGTGTEDLTARLWALLARIDQ